MNQMQSPEASLSLKDMTYLLRFVTVHEGQGGGSQEQEGLQAHYFGYVCNFATTQWFQLDDKEIKEVEEEEVLKISQDKAYMLHYVHMGSEEYHLCYQEDLSFCHSPEVSSTSPPNVIPTDKTIGETSTSKDMTTRKETIALNVLAADETIQKHSISGDETLEKESIQKCSWSISSKGCLLPGIEPKDVCGVDGCEMVFHHMCQTEWEMYQYHLEFPNGDPKDCIYDSDGKKRCIHHHPHVKLALSTVMPSTELNSSEKLLSTTQVDSEAAQTNPTTEDQATGKESIEDMSTSSWEKYHNSQELYLDAIHEMYPELNVDRLSNHMIFREDWATVRASAALKAFMAVKNMITEKKIVYSNRTSYSDDDSDESVASYIQKKPKKTNLDDEDKKFFTSLPTCYSLFFSFDTNDISMSYCPFANYNKCWRSKNHLETVLDGYECKNKAFTRDALRQHVSQSHSKSWCGEGVRIFLNELYPGPMTAKPFKQNEMGKRKRKNRMILFQLMPCLTFN